MYILKINEDCFLKFYLYFRYRKYIIIVVEDILWKLLNLKCKKK